MTRPQDTASLADQCSPTGAGFPDTLTRIS